MDEHEDVDEMYKLFLKIHEDSMRVSAKSS